MNENNVSLLAMNRICLTISLLNLPVVIIQPPKCFINKWLSCAEWAAVGLGAQSCDLPVLFFLMLDSDCIL